MPTIRVIPIIQSSAPLPSFDVYYLADPRSSKGRLYFPDSTGPYHHWLGDDDSAEHPKFVLDIPSDLVCFAEGSALLQSYREGLQSPSLETIAEKEALQEYLDWESRFPIDVFKLFDPLEYTARKILWLSDVDFEQSQCTRFVTHKLLDMNAEDKALLKPELRDKHLRLLAFHGLLARAAHQIQCSRGELSAGSLTTSLAE